jgi:hypothetical protein
VLPQDSEGNNERLDLPSAQPLSLNKSSPEPAENKPGTEHSAADAVEGQNNVWWWEQKL